MTDPPAEVAGRLPGLRDVLLALLLFGLLAVAWAAPSSLSPHDTVPDVGDPLHLGYVMAWDAHQVVRRPWALFESNSFHPYPRSLAFGDHLLPQALLVAPVSWLTGNPVLASNVAVMLALALSATAMFVLLAWATGSRGAGLVAGTAYAFNGFTRAELARVQVLSVEWWPLVFLFLAAFVVHGRREDARRSVFLLALQGLSSAYYLVYSAVLAPAWLAVAHLAARRRPHLGPFVAPALLAALLGLAVVWPYAPHMRAFSFEKPLASGKDVACSVTASVERCDGGSHVLGLGALILAAVALATWRRRTGPARVVGALGLATLVLGAAFSWGPEITLGGRPLGPGPFALLYALVPPARSMDGPERSVVLAFLGLAVLAGLGAAQVAGRLPARARGIAAGAMALLLPLEHWTAPGRGEVVPTGAHVPPVYRWLAEDAERGPVVELPVHRESAKRLWSLYPFFSTWHWRPVPVGRTSFYPPMHDRLVDSLRDFPAEDSVRVLEQLGLTTIVVHPHAWGGGERAARLQALAESPHLELLEVFTNPVDARFDGLRLGEERVYRLRSRLAPYVPPCRPSAELARAGWTVRAGQSDREVPVYVARNDRRQAREAWNPALAVDSDPATAFRTGEPQQPGDHLEIVLPRPETVAAVGLGQWYPFDEFPRHLVVVAYGPDGTRTRLDVAADRVADLRDLLEHPRASQAVLRFPPVPVKRLMLRLGETSDLAWPAWAVSEVRLYGRCGGP